MTFIKGYTPHNKGIPMGLDIRQKISTSKTGKTIAKRKYRSLSSEHKKHISESNIGKEVSLETKKN